MPPHAPSPHMVRSPRPDHESRMGAAHEAEKGDKDHPREMNHEAKADERGEHMALRDAHEQSGRWLKGTKLTSAERQRIRDIDGKYDAQVKALKKDEKAADKSGTDNDAAYEQKLTALAAQERTDIRAVLTPSQQARFDANVASRTGRKP